MKKISIIIPNYNNGKYIRRCLLSVINQDYDKKEIIIIDDGSTDDSLEIIRKMIKEYKNDCIVLICQSNLNAAIARNRGIEIAAGEYALFLDSDDVLEENILKKLVELKEKTNADLLIGNYDIIDERNKVIGKKNFVENNCVIDTRKYYERLVNMGPIPSNKLYDLRLIKENALEWGNVRIGQDLDFYLKYLLLCKNVALSSETFYKYRMTSHSMSKTYDFRIFDIVNVFSDVERFYDKNGEGLLYKKYIPTQALKHYEVQMTKQLFYKDYRVRNLIVRFFAINEKKLDYSSCDRNSNDFKKTYLKFRLKCFFRLIFTSKLYIMCRLGKTQND